jgi:hypothetical protein
MNPGICVIQNCVKINKINEMIKFGYNPTHFNSNNQVINIYNTFKQNNSIYYMELVCQIINHIEILFTHHIGHPEILTMKMNKNLILYDHNIFTIVGTFIFGNEFISLFKLKKNKTKK